MEQKFFILFVTLQILTEDHIRREGLVATYQAVLDFVPKHCRVIMDITSGLSSRLEVGQFEFPNIDCLLV